MSRLSVATAWLGEDALFAFPDLFLTGYSDMAIGLGKIFGFDYLKTLIIHTFHVALPDFMPLAYVAQFPVQGICV